VASANVADDASVGADGCLQVSEVKPCPAAEIHHGVTELKA
jgi:hypothetical protein